MARDSIIWSYTLVIIPFCSGHFDENVDQGSSLRDLPMQARGGRGGRHLTHINNEVPH